MNTHVDFAPIEVPFHPLREGAPLLMAPVRVNGQGPFDFILDTGNGLEGIALSPALAERLGIHIEMEDLDFGFPVGLSKAFSRTTINAFEIGGVNAGAMKAAVLPALAQIAEKVKARIDGNIGYWFLREYVAAFDFVRSTLVLSRETAEDGPYANILIGEDKPLIVVDVEANRETLRFVLDTGASYNCISTGAADRLGLKRGAGFAVNYSADDSAFNCKLDSLRVAGQTQHGVGIAAVNFLDTLSEAAGSQIDGVLGHSFWCKYRLVIDYPRKRLLLGAGQTHRASRTNEQ